MFKNRRLLTWALVCSLGFSACKSKFERLQESTDVPKKYQAAIKFYEEKNYNKALLLFDDLYQKYVGRAEAEDLAYYHAYTNYKLKDYTTARYQFKLFADTYPTSPKAEECRYMSAYCFYLESPNATLDQENTVRAMESLQLFINLHPRSERVQEASRLIQSLRDKLEGKAFANAKQYYTLGEYDAQNYRAAVIAFRNVLRDYPDTKYAEEIEFLSIRSQYLFALNSIETRQEERFSEAITMANEFIEEYPESKYLKDTRDLSKLSETRIEQVRKILAGASPAKKAEEQKENEVNPQNQ
jgi:outer membrane protein assembly factor BamD